METINDKISFFFAEYESRVDATLHGLARPETKWHFTTDPKRGFCMEIGYNKTHGFGWYCPIVVSFENHYGVTIPLVVKEFMEEIGVDYACVNMMADGEMWISDGHGIHRKKIGNYEF